MIPGRTCVVCSTPIRPDYVRCYRCNQAFSVWGPGLADRVMTLAYAYEHAPGQGWRHQSEQTMWSYKNAQPGPGCVADLTLVLVVALHFHRMCAVRAAGGRPWGSWAVVPSSRHDRPGVHPLVGLANGAGLGTANSGLPDQAVLTLASGRRGDREVRGDLYAVANPEVVAGRHVLVLEDTWVTGGSAQSVAVTLKRAGAAAVTVLAIARWLKESDQFANAAGFYAGLIEPYDPLVCPVLGTGARCRGPLPS